MQTFLTTGNVFLMSSVNAQPRFFFFFSSDEAMRKAGVAHNKSSKDMESHVFMKAKTRVKLLCLFSEVTGLSKFWDEPQKQQIQCMLGIGLCSEYLVVEILGLCMFLLHWGKANHFASCGCSKVDFRPRD